MNRKAEKHATKKLGVSVDMLRSKSTVPGVWWLENVKTL